MNDWANQVCQAYRETQLGYALEPLGSAGGFSGARFWRVRTATGVYCLRAWPPWQSHREWLGQLHRLQMTAASLLPFVPRPLAVAAGSETFVEKAGRLWELTPWMPGNADFRSDPTPAKVEAAFTALARLLSVWQKSAAPVGIPVSIQSRCKHLSSWSQWSEAALRQQVQTTTRQELTPLALRAANALCFWAEPAKQFLQPWSCRKLPQQSCLCDITHDHVLFQGVEVSGIIDYGGVRVDTVAADVARLLGSMVGDDPALRSIALAAFDRVRPLSALEKDLIDPLDFTGTVVAVGNWIRWLVIERRPFDNPIAVARRLEELVVRLERWRDQPDTTPAACTQVNEP